jgi:hypothetical protein
VYNIHQFHVNIRKNVRIIDPSRPKPPPVRDSLPKRFNMNIILYLVSEKGQFV